MISRDKFTAMLELQEKLNSKVHPEWRSQNFAWHRAIMVEGVELLDHVGWKWWKKQTPDFAQAKIELVDIWHFMLSMMLSRGGASAEMHYDRAVLDQHLKFAAFTLPEKLDRLIETAALGRHSVGLFSSLMGELGLTWDELYTTYVAKNVLNTFRQDHGYKDGAYIKLWSGLEDNVVLERLMTQLPDATPEQLRTMLEKAYALELAAQ